MSKYRPVCVACDLGIGDQIAPIHHGESCSRYRRMSSASDGAYWLGMLGFALAGPAALEWSAQTAEDLEQDASASSGERWAARHIRRNIRRGPR